MTETLDLPGVKAFTDRVKVQIAGCENSEGDYCSTLDGRMHTYARLCRETLEKIRDWSEAVFTGRVPYDPVSERLLQEQGKELVAVAGPLAGQGWTELDDCFAYDNLIALQKYVTALNWNMERWMTPRLSVAPGPRVRLSEDLVARMKARLEGAFGPTS